MRLELFLRLAYFEKILELLVKKKLLNCNLALVYTN